MNTVEVLKASKALIERTGLTKRAYARKEGVDLKIGDTSGDCYCVLGALNAVAAPMSGAHLWAEPLRLSAVSLSDALREKGYRGSVDGYNDLPSTTKEDVLALFDAAIVIAERRMYP